MKNIATILFSILFAVLFFSQADAQSAAQWNYSFVGNNAQALYPGQVAIPQLGTQNCLGTNANGVLGAGTCGSNASLTAGSGLVVSGNCNPLINCTISAPQQVSYLNCPHDGVTDAATCINTAITAAAAYTTLLLPCGNIYIHSSLSFPALKGAVALLGCGNGQTQLTTDQNIPILNMGSYTYTTGNTWSYSTYPLYYDNIGNFSINNTSASAVTVPAINLNGFLYGYVHDITAIGYPDAISVNPISGFNHIERISAQGSGSTTPIDTIVVNGIGYSGQYNSTGNIFMDILAPGVKRAGVTFVGCTFGDFVVSGVNGFGVASGGQGSGGGSIAGVYLDRTGTCQDTSFYASRWTVSDVKWDGTSDWVVRGIGSDNGTVSNLADGGGVVSTVSFDSTSSNIGYGSVAKVYTIATLPNCVSGTQSLRLKISNGIASPTYNGAVSTTGTSYALVECNGSGWVYK